MSTPLVAMPHGVDVVVIPRTTDLGDGFSVRRALPSAQRRMVGPFVFFDQMGPASMQSGSGLDVRPHPHIGLATVTYLFDGEIMHRDSLGSVQSIRPGELNWMTAGRGIVHSERTPPAVRASGGNVFGIQAWVALPRGHEETAPTFTHHPRHALPLLANDGCEARLIVGTLAGVRAPVDVFSDMFYADVVLQVGARFFMPVDVVERAAYVVSGRVAVGDAHGSVFESAQLIVFAPGAEIVLTAVDGPVHLMALGGEPMDGPRHLWWNFVSSSPERIEQAKADWQAGRFPAVPEETEFIPLPPSPPSKGAAVPPGPAAARQPVDYP